jgi:hypothetical protein
MEPSWREGDIGRTFSFFVTTEEVDQLGFQRACAEARASGFPNARVFTPRMLEWASIFHPAFFAAMSRGEVQPGASLPRRLRLNVPTSRELNVATTLYWLQSTLFLAGVTLSAALIQGRFSRGTVASKLDRLWQAGGIAQAADLPDFGALRLKDEVANLAREIERPEKLLVPLKHCFAKAIAALAASVPVEAEQMIESELGSELSDRFGFRHDLAAAIGPRLRCMIVYGSSVTSNAFADYDVIIVADERDEVLLKLRNLAPSYRGVELNVSVFEPEEFWNYQVLSGDNLSHHGICIKVKRWSRGKSKLTFLRETSASDSSGFGKLSECARSPTLNDMRPAMANAVCTNTSQKFP